MNLLKTTAEADGDGIALTAGNMRVALPAVSGISPGDTVTCGIRPEHIAISDDTGLDDITAKVFLSEQLGGETYLYCEADSIDNLTIHQPGQLPVNNGEVLKLRFDRAQMHLFDADGKVITNGVSS